VKAFLQELSKLGWIEGKNFTIEYRFAEQRNERLPELAAELVRLKVDLIVTAGGPTPFAAKKATTTIPIVMTTSTNPRRKVWLPVWRGREAMSPVSRV
jgi:putative ABC transport system substrate-binding protein